MNERYFEDVDFGDEVAAEWTATRDEVAAYLKAESDALGRGGGGRFLDADGARALGFPAPIVPGALSMAHLTRLITDWMGAHGWLESIDVDYRRPVLHDDHVRAIGLVTDAEEVDGRGRVRLDVYLENDRGERPLQGVATVTLPRRGKE